MATANVASSTARGGVTKGRRPPRRGTAFFPRDTHQDLAEGFVLQESEVLRQLAGVEVVEQQRHFPLLGHRRHTLGHLPLPLVGRPGRGGENADERGPTIAEEVGR